MTQVGVTKSDTYCSTNDHPPRETLWLDGDITERTSRTNWSVDKLHNYGGFRVY